MTKAKLDPVRILRARRKALRKQNNAKYGYDQFGMRVQPKRLASHSHPLQVIISRREHFSAYFAPGPK